MRLSDNTIVGVLDLGGWRRMTVYIIECYLSLFGSFQRLAFFCYEGCYFFLVFLRQVLLLARLELIFY